MKQTAELVPGWDGNPRGWRRYTREVTWFVMGTKKSLRPFLAPRLIAKLTGPARLLAMGWNQAEFRGKDGVRVLLDRLANSPLVRKSLPNTSAILSQYFTYKRGQQEAISSYLVREALYYEEFVESLMTLKDEHDGRPRPLLPDLSDEDEDGDEDDDDDKKKKGDYTRLPTEDPGEPSGSGGPRDGGAPAAPAASGTGAGTLNDYDSFILKQLRGWRLLQGACLSHEEWRSVMASTANRLDYPNVCAALTILFDEQAGSRGPPAAGGPSIFALDKDDEWEDWSYFDPSDVFGYYAGWDDEWEDYDDYFHDAAAEEETKNDEENAANPDKEAMVQQTWSQAHRNTQLARKDRGFGKGSQAKGSECHICGHPGHFARNCPDRFAPKGKGKFMNYQYGPFDDEWNYMAAFSKGKGKGKSKMMGKHAHYMEDLMYQFKGRPLAAKSKGKGKSKNQGSVNAYSMDYMGFHGLEFENDPCLDLQASVKSAAPPSQAEQPGHLGMLDSGATCSAGPEGSIKRLITALMEKDHKASVTFDTQKRPRFRYGSGKWGKALYKVTLASSLSSNTFEAYVLPDPEESREPWFQENTMLVPVLVGMDFITSNAMIVDFTDGNTFFASHEVPRPFQLPRNSKGHYMVDLVDFVTNGQECLQGHPQIHVLQAEPVDGSAEADLQQTCLHMDNFTLIFMHECDDAGQEVSPGPLHEKLFQDMIKRRLMMNRETGLMGCLPSLPSFNSIPGGSRSNGPKGQGSQAERPGPFAEDHCRSSRPQDSRESMAMSGTPCARQSSKQQVGTVDPLLSLQPSPGVHSDEGCPFEQHPGDEPCGREARPGRASKPASGGLPARGRAGEEHDRQGDCRDPSQHHDPEGQGEACQEQACGQDSSEDWSKTFRNGRLPTSCSPDFDSKKHKLGHAKCPKQPQLLGLSHGGGDGSATGTSGCSHATAEPRGGCGAQHEPRTGLQLSQYSVSAELNDDALRRPLPLRVGESMVNLMTHVQDDLRNLMSDMVYDSKPLVWEMFCSPESSLSAACERHGVKAVRINLANHFDLYKDSTWPQVYNLYNTQKPKAIWVSPKCTFYCDFVDLNYKHRPEVLEKYRRRERRMLKNLTEFLKYVAKDGAMFYWEWPHRCRGWKEHVVAGFIETLQKFLDLWWCRVDGCRFGMKAASGNFIQKSWSILTCDIGFYNTFRLRCCLNNHQHEWIQGKETNKSAYYPVALCNSIARHWQKHLLPQRWLKMLWTAPVQGTDIFKDLLVAEDDAPEDEEAPAEFPAVPDLYRDQPPVEELPPAEDGSVPPPTWDDGSLVSKKDQERWMVKLTKFHKAAGHASPRNLARMLADAQVDKWKIRAAMNFRCPLCEELRPGGTSSKQIPPASIRSLPRAWEQLGMDIGEWTVPGRDLKIKFLLMMDMATRYRVVEPLFSYQFGRGQVENADQIIEAVTTKWLMDKPRPQMIIPDNANTFLSHKFTSFMSDLCIAVMPPPDNESWAHGTVERAVGHIKETASLIQQGLPDQNPLLTLALATSAINSTEYTQGFTSMQWAFGKQAELGDEEFQQQLSVPLHERQNEYLKLMNQRQEAEDAARKAKATLVMQKLANTSIRQPVRSFDLAQPVMVWRKFLPTTVYKGRRGGKKFTDKPRWVGPGRVVLHELVPGQDESDRRQVVWVVLGNTLYRASVHSVRPLSEREPQLFEAQGDNSYKWKELTDMIPSRNYIDVTNEEPNADEKEMPVLPDQPSNQTIIKPKVRFFSKFTPTDDGFPIGDPAYPPGVSSTPGVVNEYDAPEPKKVRFAPVDEDIDLSKDEPPATSSRRSSTTSGTPLLDGPAGPSDDQPHSEDQEPTDLPAEPEPKRARHDSDDGLVLEAHQAIQEIDSAYVMNVELDLSSNRQRKMLLRNPDLFLAKKMASSEVNYRRLNEADKKLFENAKDSEVTSFLKTEAVRRCLNWEEQQQARQSDRVLRARWVLVWKNVPEEDQEQAQQDAASNAKSCHRPDGKLKAKARIVVLGFEHPDLLQDTFKSSAPVQSQLMRNLSLYLVAQRGWSLESLDMSTAFLQTGQADMESQRLWTSGVPELKKALGASDGEVLRLLRNVYGNATAPRGLWTDVDRTFTGLGGRRIIGDSSFWVWTEPNPSPRNEADQHRVIGFVGGHVDDFMRSGDTNNENWLQIRDKINKAYKWGSEKTQSFRHTGIDLEVCEKGGERWIQLNQDHYVEGLPDLAIPEERLRQDPKSTLSPSEMAACRASLGALQWVATQTQLQICARVNLLLTELTVYKTVAVAKEISELVKEVRKDPLTLKMWQLPEVKHWQDVTIVTLADQAHSNRPQGGSTGGLITFIGGPQHYEGQPGRLNILSWRTWRLRRKAISTNDGEIQCMLEGEDANFRTRFLWSQLNGCICDKDLLSDANKMVSFVKGIVGTDSRGGYDAVNKNEGPLLGLSNARSALQAYQLREQLQSSMGKMIWISGDWNLSDGMTKKNKIARQGLMQFLKNWMWRLTFSPDFIMSEKKARKQGQSAVEQMRQLQALIPVFSQEEFWGDETVKFIHRFPT
eukprot:Skav207534  [mRNA]  locus=scaffold756:114473:122071:+ [translate_table: standard]